MILESPANRHFMETAGIEPALYSRREFSRERALHAFVGEVVRGDQERRAVLTMAIRYCAVCDAGRKPLEVPGRPCRHKGTEHRRIFNMPVVPANPDVRLPPFEAIRSAVP